MIDAILPLAQSDGPARLILESAAPFEPDPRLAVWRIGAFAVVVLAAALVVIGVVALRRRRFRDPSAAAFSMLSAALELKGPSRQLLARLAEAHPHATPTALLLSRHALHEAVQRYSHGQLSPEDRAALDPIVSEHISETELLGTRT